MMSMKKNRPEKKRAGKALNNYWTKNKNKKLREKEKTLPNKSKESKSPKVRMT